MMLIMTVMDQPATSSLTGIFPAISKIQSLKQNLRFLSQMDMQVTNSLSNEADEIDQEGNSSAGVSLGKGQQYQLVRQNKEIVEGL